jgi:DNA segregation ATPase FtsK/SpoIIIE, S-DNA-T family
MARVTVTQLKHASLDKEWRDAWIRDPSIPTPIVRPPKKSAPVNSTLFHRLVEQFSNWLTAEPNLRSTSKLSRYENLWDAFWNLFAKKELLALLEQQGPESADRLTKALKNWCQELLKKRGVSGSFKNWRSLILTSEFQFDDVPVSTTHGIVHVAGRPDCVVLDSNGPVVVDYKLSRGANLKTDLLQAVIYAALLHRTRPALPVSARLEYYEPELHVIVQNPDQIKRLFAELVAPTLEELAARLAENVPEPAPASRPPRPDEQRNPDFGPENVNT